MRFITPGFFAALGVPILAGRDFNDSDSRSKDDPVVIVSETLAKRMFPNQDAVNRHVYWTDPVLEFAIGLNDKPHRIIGIWAVVVKGRVFVRSWSLKPRSWYRTFLEEPRGAIQVEGHEIPVRAVFTRSERLKDEVDQAYREKYNTPGSLHFVRGFRIKKRRDTTTELIPLEC